jgi:hypothetical protein
MGRGMPESGCCDLKHSSRFFTLFSREERENEKKMLQNETIFIK